MRQAQALRPSNSASITSAGCLIALAGVGCSSDRSAFDDKNRTRGAIGKQCLRGKCHRDRKHNARKQREHRQSAQRRSRALPLLGNGSEVGDRFPLEAAYRRHGGESINDSDQGRALLHRASEHRRDSDKRHAGLVATQ